ncbi:MAG: transposase [Candidatus Brocadiales bacterium]
MRYNPEKHHRKSIRLKEYDYSQPGAYFVTICTQDRKCLFGNIVNDKTVLSQMGKIASEFWNNLHEYYGNIALDQFIVMPNHVHGIIMINDNTVGAIHELPLQRNERRRMLIPKVIGFFKMNTAKQINIIRNTSGIQVWQRNYYEHIIRNEDKLNRIRKYIINNPLQWQFDKENPERIQDSTNIKFVFYQNQWGNLEETIYGKRNNV